MKKLLLLILICTFVLSGCGRVDTDRISVVTTVFPPYDFVREIAGDAIQVNMLLKPGGDLHSYEPTPKDIALISECDIFIYTGGKGDEWVSNILENSRDKTSVAMMDCVEVIDSSHHGHEAEADEHVWTSPLNAIKISEIICEKLCEVDPENTDFYKKNLESYVSRLTELDAEIQATADSSKRRELVFADPFAVVYFAERYNLECRSAFHGCTGESEADPKTVASLIDKINTDKIPVVLYGEFSNQSMADTISAATGAKKMLFHSCHNLSAEDFNSGKTYIDIMYENSAVLKEALSL